MEQHTKNDFIGGQMIVELLVAFGLASILLPAIMIGFVSGSSGKVQQQQRLKAIGYLQEGVEGVRSIREAGWVNIANGNTYHLVANGNGWGIQEGSETLGDFTRVISITDITPFDPSIKKITVTVSWSNILPSSVSTIFYLTRYLGNKTYTQTTQADFNAGFKNGTQVTNIAGGEVILANNNRAKWCSPALSTGTIDLPDGPPVAVAAFADVVSVDIPNTVFTATAPTAATSVKMAYLNVTANSENPTPTLKGIFTLNPAEYSLPTYFPVSPGIDNNFKTNDVKSFVSASGKKYALLATDKPDREVVVVQVSDGVNDTFQDTVNKIYRYHTFFNTRAYQGDIRSTPNQDQAPFGYGAVAISVLGTRGYALSGGYLYVFDLSNIDSKTVSSGLDMVGCRIELDGFDCQPGSGTDRKYTSGETGTTWSSTTLPAHNDCSDGGNIELYADNQMSLVQVSGSTYVFIAVGAGTNPELNIANVTNVPTASTNPKINNSSCGRISGGASGWKRGGSLDFNSMNGTEEAANSVFAKSDGTRAYMSSNGGIDGNNDGHPDSHQFYIINTTNKTSPSFLSGSPSTGATSGYYNGDSTNIQLYPRRSLTVLNGLRAILVGQDGKPNDQIEPKEYQVLNIENEATPFYCGGINFLPGFNDLTSVSEADSDNFVYMVANTLEKQLKIIEGGPDSGIYVPSGTFESSVFTATAPAAFNRFNANITQPTNTTLKMQVGVATPSGGLCSGASFSYVGPGGDSGAFYTPVGSSVSASFPFGTFGGYQNPERCFKYKTYFETMDFNQTPVLNDMTINYSP
jgi:type II secretory pathway pseudopilin PulG